MRTLSGADMTPRARSVTSHESRQAACRSVNTSTGCSKLSVLLMHVASASWRTSSGRRLAPASVRLSGRRVSFLSWPCSLQVCRAEASHRSGHRGWHVQSRGEERQCRKWRRHVCTSTVSIINFRRILLNAAS